MQDLLERFSRAFVGGGDWEALIAELNEGLGGTDLLLVTSERQIGAEYSLYVVVEEGSTVIEMVRTSSLTIHPSTGCVHYGFNGLCMLTCKFIAGNREKIRKAFDEQTSNVFYGTGFYFGKRDVDLYDLSDGILAKCKHITLDASGSVPTSRTMYNYSAFRSYENPAAIMQALEFVFTALITDNPKEVSTIKEMVLLEAP